MIRQFIFIIAVLLAADSLAQDTVATKPKKQRKMTDTVGVVNGTVIQLYDFRELLSDIARSEAPDSVVQDTEFTRYVNMTWERLVSDVLVQQEIQKRKVNLSETQVIDRLLRKPPEELKQEFIDPSGAFNANEYEQFLRSTEPDTARMVVVHYFQMAFEQADLMQAIAPKAKSERARIEAFTEWLRKAMKSAHIDDRRTSFGYY